MTVNRKRLLAVIILGIIFSLPCGCAKKEQPESGVGSAGGTYVEKEITLPDYDSLNMEHGMVQLQDGSIVIDVRREDGWVKKVSTDKGLSFETRWESLDIWKGREKKEIECHNRVSVATGESMALVSDKDEREADCIYITAQGEIHSFTIAWPVREEGLGEMLWSGGDNRFYMTMGQGIYRILPEEEKVEYLFSTSELLESVQYLNVCGDYLYAVSSKNLYMYRLSTEELVENDEVLEEFLKTGRRENSVLGKFTCLMDDDGTGERIYVVTADGIYSHVPYGNTMEQVVDGEICTIGDDRLYYVNFEVIGEEQTPVFLLLFDNDKLFRYGFDPEAALFTKRTLRLFSMYESGALKRAAIEFRKNNPEIIVRYEVGMTGEDGVTENDVLRNLGMELAAGNGPDIILMDGLPLESYEEKDILLDLSELLESLDGSNTPLKQVTHTYDRGGEIYCIPATWSFAVLIGREDYLKDVHTLAQLADVAEELGRQDIESGLFGFKTAKEALETLSLGSYGSFMKEDGSLDKEVVADFLRQSKRIYESQISVLSEEFMEAHALGEEYSGIMGKRTGTRNVEMYAVDKWRNEYEFAAGWVTGSLKDYSYWLSVVNDMENGTYIRMPGAGQYCYSADNLLAISQGTENLEDAKAFVTYMLSYGFQRGQREELGGIPINEVACLEWTGELYPRSGSVSIRMDATGDYKQLDFVWPTRAQVNQLREMALENEGVQVCSTLVYDKVIDIGQQVLLGECSVENAVEKIDQDVRLYLAE